jgi:hypothetical protein
MHPADILKPAIITPFGLYEFLQLTFGMRNAGSAFQQLMGRMLVGFAMVFIYLDDIISGQLIFGAVSAGCGGGIFIFLPPPLSWPGHHQQGEIGVPHSRGPFPWPPCHRRENYALTGAGGGHPGQSEASDSEVASSFPRTYFAATQRHSPAYCNWRANH